MIEYADTGSTLLNLACSDMSNGGFKLGKLVNIVGDSSSGKSFLALTTLACAAYNEGFDEHVLYYDDVEAASEFDMKMLFGSKAERIISPYEEGKASDRIEEFYYTAHNLLKEKVPFIYVLDSMDALSSDAENEKFEENKDLFNKGKPAKGSYGDGKAKFNSQGLRQIVRSLKDTNSLLIIISQTRDNIGISFAPKTRAGGKALKFYSSYEIWLAHAGYLDKTVRGVKRRIGIDTRVKLSKNKVTGGYHELRLPIRYNYGVDDVSSCVDYLVDEKIWLKKGTKIEAPEFELEEKRDKIIAYIENEDKEDEVRALAETVWHDVKKQCDPNRKKRFE